MAFHVRGYVAVVATIALVGCTATPSPQPSTAAQPSAEASAPPSSSALAAGSVLAPGTYADVVTTGLVIRSEPGLSEASEVYPDELYAPMSVYIADGPVDADGLRWFQVVAFDENGSVPALAGWTPGESEDGDVWLEPIGDHADGAWTELDAGSAPEDISPRSAGIGPDGLIYFFGMATWSLDPATGGWTELAPMATPRADPLVAGTSDGRFYVIGGAITTSISSDDPSLVEVYDAGADGWTSVADAPVAPSFEGIGVAVAGADGMVRLFGPDAVLTYDPTTDAWAPAAADPRTWWDATESAGSGGLLMLEYDGTLRPFDTTSGTFGEPTGVSGITRHGAAVVTGLDGRAYVIGGSVAPGLGATCSGWRSGEGALSATSLVETFDAATGEWATAAPLPMGLSEPSAFATPDGLLVMGLTAEPEREFAMARQALPTVVAGAPHPYSGPPVESGCG